MGGRFDILDDKSVSSGVAKWSKATGVSNLEGGGIRGQGSDSSLLGEITTMAFESTSKVRDFSSQTPVYANILHSFSLYL
jgi:hypothetical protein